MEGLEGLTICTWVWGSKYGDHYVRKLASSVERNLKRPFRFRVFAPQEEDEHLTRIPGCFARLRMFDPAWQEENDIRGQLVCLDLDVVVTGNLESLFDRVEDLVVIHGANSSNPCKFNGSMVMIRAGAHPEVWRDFDRSKITAIPHYEFPDDQGWLWHKVPDAAGWRVGPESGVYAFKKPGWPGGDDLPSGARIVVFPGWRDPSKFEGLPWVREHWR